MGKMEAITFLQEIVAVLTDDIEHLAISAEDEQKGK